MIRYNFIVFTALCAHLAVSQVFCMQQTPQKEFQIENNTGSAISALIGLDGRTEVPIVLANAESVRIPFTSIDSVRIDPVGIFSRSTIGLQPLDYVAPVKAAANLSPDRSFMVKINAPESSGLMGWRAYMNPYRLVVHAFKSPKDKQEKFLVYGSDDKRLKDDFMHVINLLKANPEREITAAEVLGLASNATSDQIKRMHLIKAGPWSREAAQKALQDPQKYNAEVFNRAREILRDEYEMTPAEIKRSEESKDRDWKDAIKESKKYFEEKIIGDSPVLRIFLLIGKIIEADDVIARPVAVSGRIFGKALEERGWVSGRLPAHIEESEGAKIRSQALTNRAELVKQLKEELKKLIPGGL